MSSYAAIRKLDGADRTDGFDCGQPALNLFLQRFALPNQKAGGARTYVCCVPEGVAGFYSLAVGSVQPANAPARITKGLSRNPIPVMLLARLAVDIRHQHQGLGRALLKDALLRTLQAADIAGIRAVIVHAKHDAARRWYESFDFEPSPTDPYHLFLLLKDITRAC
ncbi:MAG: GNAT family N-acetyltransferase [Deltaproteobacteria bacterium]|nr:GNAT family N-acetyltransferase [Deltaproteobacteria bacterium]